MKLVKVTQWRVPDPVVGSRMEGEKFCDGWFGFEEECFSSSIHMTILNGDVVFREGVSTEEPKGRRFEFKKL